MESASDWFWHITQRSSATRAWKRRSSVLSLKLSGAGSLAGWAIAGVVRVSAKVRIRAAVARSVRGKANPPGPLFQRGNSTTLSIVSHAAEALPL
ncbi:hypothetical protein [Lysobacter gummosus]|uniref:hypothetical protein n=1 Tax=Lysobacter gummosus TaxID=262324 RepID=UPI003639FB51